MSSEKFAKRNVISIAAAVILLALAATIALRQPKEQPAETVIQSWHYDLGTGELFAAEPHGMRMVNAPSGIGMGVLAHVFSCGACTPDDRIVVAIESLSDDAKALQQQLEADPTSVSPQVVAQTMATSQVVAAPPKIGEQPKWVPRSSREGFALIDKADTLCNGIPANRCLP